MFNRTIDNNRRGRDQEGNQFGRSSLLHNFMVPDLATDQAKTITMLCSMRNGERPARGFGRGQCRLDACYYYPDRLIFSSWPTNTLRKFSPYHGGHCSRMTWSRKYADR
ncbi:uncharacterized protein LOC105734919 [Apis florea]|uniref:uncharacterized protein LOC105734919 n=1 Tax=Apis florea TaxID=7463 RepID=UPI0012FED33C|nr:uncharacterized protein LOC105734919 [Apis florea]